MKKLQYHAFALAVAALLVGSGAAQASGSYNARPPRVPQPEGRDRVDQEKYALGKQVYNHKAKLTVDASADRATQERRLRDLEMRLPERARRDANLTSMAGKLSAQQLDALDYYISKRYPAK
jgi:hypothetical protein